jgi:hypothetical protein
MTRKLGFCFSVMEELFSRERAIKSGEDVLGSNAVTCKCQTSSFS